MANNPKRQSQGRAANGSAHTDPVSPDTAAVETAPAAPAPPAPAPAAAASGPSAPAPTPAAPPAARGADSLKITDLKDLSIQKLTQIAKEKNVAGATGMRKQDLIFQILKAQTEQS